jgi:hypothetical protein
VVPRLLTLALVLEGHPREVAARTNGMERQTLRDWVHRCNGGGVAGLRSGAKVERVANGGTESRRDQEP